MLAWDIYKGVCKMRAISLVLALVVSAAASSKTHEMMPMPLSGLADFVIFVVVYLVVSQSIKAYLDE